MNKILKIKNLIYFICIILIIIIILLVIYIIKFFYDMHNSKQESNILNEISENFINTEGNFIEAQEAQIQKTDRILQLEELQKQNSDIIGWIEIENTNINYPVLQTTDNSYYMNHNYKKQYSMNGSIFLDKSYSWDPPSSNLLIYGHNMKNGTMFQDLLKYKNLAYYKEHPVIRFTTTSEDVYYEIISVFESRVYYKSEKNVFRYYYFVNSNNEQEYNEFVQNAKNASLYDTGKTAIYGDQLMTLSTCSYHIKDGRFVVVAKKVIEGSP